jgi:hypothetical protein
MYVHMLKFLFLVRLINMFLVLSCGVFCIPLDLNVESGLQVKGMQGN